MITITPIYAACIAILMAVLATATSMTRGQTNILLGDGEDPTLRVAIRRFGNLSEFAAVALLLLLLLELQGLNAFWLHVYGATFVALRLIHAAVLRSHGTLPTALMVGRFVGSAGTSLLMIAGAATLLVRAL